MGLQFIHEHLDGLLALALWKLRHRTEPEECGLLMRTCSASAPCSSLVAVVTVVVNWIYFSPGKLPAK